MNTFEINKVKGMVLKFTNAAYLINVNFNILIFTLHSFTIYHFS